MRPIQILTLVLAAILTSTSPATAQTLNVTSGGVTYSFNAAQTGVMTYGDGGTTLTVQGKTFTLADVSLMKTVEDKAPSDNLVTVTYDGSSATVTVAGNVAQYVSASVSGAHVTINQSDDAGDDTCGEITYRLSGESSDGSLLLNGNYKASVELTGLTLTSAKGAPLDLQDSKRVAIRVAEGTVNTLADCASGSQKGCLVCKGHLEFKQKGTLNITGNTAHGIYAKEYIEIKNTNINVLSSVKDGVNCNQYLMMESGSLSILSPGDDGVQVAYKDATDREAEDTGTITIKGGTLNISTTATAVKALKAEGDFVMTGGSITAKTSGGGLWDSAKSKTKASSCVGADGMIKISGGTLDLTSTGSGGKGLSCDGDLTIDGGTITISTSGGMYAYVNGKEYTSYTGNSDSLNSDQKSSPKGIKSDSGIIINDGTISITTTGKGGEGIESKATITINGGTIKVRASDDGINSTSTMTINGGDIDVIATANDGLDSNGNMIINGGTIRSFGGSSPECGIDAAEEDGYTVYFNGGTLIGVGASNSYPRKDGCEQPYLSASINVTSGSTVTVKNGDTVLATFEIPLDYTGGSSSTGSTGGFRPGGMGGTYGKSVIITCPGLETGKSYTIVSGTTSTTATATLKGSSSTGWH